MKQAVSDLEKKILEKAETIVVVLIVVFCLFLSYILYAMFNRPADAKTLDAIKKESDSANIVFDKKTISNVLELNKKYERQVDTSQPGKNPFLTY